MSALEIGEDGQREVRAFAVARVNRGRGLRLGGYGRREHVRGVQRAEDIVAVAPKLGDDVGVEMAARAPLDDPFRLPIAASKVADDYLFGHVDDPCHGSGEP